MNAALSCSGAILVSTLLLHACGGGGGNDGGGGGDGGGSSSNTRVSASTNQITVSAEPGQYAPTGTATVTVANPPAEGLTVQGRYSDTGIEIIDFVPVSNTQATLQITFRLPGTLEDGTYGDSIELMICPDETCATQVLGSPLNFNTSYTVSGGLSATLSRETIERTVDSRDSNFGIESVQLILDKPAEAALFFQLDHTANAVFRASASTITETVTEVSVNFLPGSNFGSGLFEDTITVTACYDPSCARQIGGSPFVIATKLTVGAGAEPDIDPLVVASRVGLAHDVVDAEFSEAHDAVVMASTYPDNALYVYDVAAGTERKQLLAKAPTAVSVASDGLTAAVGHDALVSIVDLAQAGQVGAPAPILLNVSVDVLDIVLDGHGRVHALPRRDQWSNIHSIDIATNTESLSSGMSLYAGAFGRLHPSGDYIYTADNGLSPSDIAKWDISTGVAAAMYDSPYHGDFEMCGNLWFRDDGSTIYTACGNTFHSSPVQADDMVYAGALQLSDSDTYGWRIGSLSESTARGEIVLLEMEWYPCHIEGAGLCYTHFAVYESAFLNRQAVYSLGAIDVAGVSHAQRGLFVFHDASGDNRILLSRIEDAPDGASEYYLSIVN